MEKAYAVIRQPEVTIRDFPEGRFFFLYCNEKPVTLTEPEEFEGFEYDFHQFTDNSIDPEDVKANPAKFLNHVPETKPVLTPTEKAITDIELALAEIVGMIIGG